MVIGRERGCLSPDRSGVFESEGKGGDLSLDRVARVSEIIAGSPISFDEAIRIGFERANKTLRNITGLRILEQRVAIEDGKIMEFRVRMEVIFVLET
jgi:flavin-binding protein dodecin